MSSDDTAPEAAAFTPDPAYAKSVPPVDTGETVQAEAETEAPTEDAAEGASADVDAGAEALAGAVADASEGEEKQEEEGSDELTLEKARALLEEASDPEAFLQKHSEEKLKEHFSRLSRQNEELRQAQEQLKHQQAQYQEAVEFKKRFESDRAGFLHDALLENPETYDRVTDKLVGNKDPAVAASMAVDKKIAEAEARWAAERQEMQQQMALVQQQKDADVYLSRAISVADDKYPYLTQMQSSEKFGVELGELLVAHNEATGEWLTVEDAVGKLGEQQLVKLRAAAKAANLIEKQADTDSSQAGSTKKPARPKEPSGPTTLTNRLGGNVSRAEPVDLEKLSDNERMRRIAAKYS